MKFSLAILALAFSGIAVAQQNVTMNVTTTTNVTMTNVTTTTNGTKTNTTTVNSTTTTSTTVPVSSSSPSETAPPSEMGSGSGEPSGTMEPSGPAPVPLVVNGTVLQVLAEEEDLSMLYKAAQTLDPSVLFQITNSSGITIFAPVNDAVNGLDPKFLNDSWRPHLTFLIRNHVVNGVLRAANITDGYVITPVISSESYTASVSNGVVTLKNEYGFKDGVTVTQADLDGGNGVVHKIDGILMPNQLALTLLDLAKGNPAFSKIQTLVTQSGLEDEISADYRTVFAPSDAAFQALPSDFLQSISSDQEKVKEILSHHLISGVYSAEMLTDGMSLTSINGYLITVGVSGMGRFAERTINGYKVSAADNVASNGIAHIIDGVLAEEAPPAVPTAPTTPTAPTPTSPTAPTSKGPEKTSSGNMLTMSVGMVLTTCYWLVM